MNEKEFYENLSDQLLSEIEKEREGQAKLLSELNNNLKRLLEAQEQRNAILSRMQSLEFGLAELIESFREWSRERTRRHLAGLRELLNQFVGQFQAQFKPLYNRLGIQLPELKQITIESKRKDNSSRARMKRRTKNAQRHRQLSLSR